MTGADLRQAVKERFPSAVLGEDTARDMDSITLDRAALREVALFLRDGCGMDMLTDLTAIDWAGKRSERFELVALFLSIGTKARLRVRVPIPERDPEYDSLSPVYKVANWLEREIFDMYGLKAKGHPNLRRILTHEGFEGYPLRKDYPVNRRQPVRPAVEDILTQRPYPGKSGN